MRVRQLSPSGDYLFGNSAQNFLVNSPAAVGQVVCTSLRLWVGEWYLDNTVGCPYPEGVLGKRSQTQADLTIQSYVRNVTANGQQIVSDIKNFSSSLNNVTRAYSCTMTIDTIYGPTQVDLQNLINF